MIRVVIPFGGNDAHRRSSLDWLSRHLPVLLPDASVSVGVCEGVWSKAVAVANAISPDWDDDDVLVVHDADVWIPALPLTLQFVGEYGWMTPHLSVHRMNQDLTARVIAGDVSFDELGRDNWDEAPYLGIVGGGCVALTVASYRSCPLDPRFEGWGQEDEAWGYALQQTHGSPWRGSQQLYHFWHPHPKRRSRQIGSVAGEQLSMRYRAARSDTFLMQRLLAEFR